VALDEALNLTKGVREMYYYIEILDGSTWKHYNYNCQTVDSSNFYSIIERHLTKFKGAWQELARRK